MVVLEGETVVLECLVTAEPIANITWMMDGAVLPMCSEELSSSLGCLLMDAVLIQEAGEESVGQYSCNATNAQGMSLYEVTVTLGMNRSELGSEGRYHKMDCLLLLFLQVCQSFPSLLSLG